MRGQKRGPVDRPNGQNILATKAMRPESRSSPLSYGATLRKWDGGSPAPVVAERHSRGYLKYQISERPVKAYFRSMPFQDHHAAKTMQHATPRPVRFSCSTSGEGGGAKGASLEWAAGRFPPLIFFLTGYKNLIYQIR
jgi:hypothetical protein